MVKLTDSSCSGRKSDTVSRELGVPVVMIDRWWLQREDITVQYEKFCRINRDDTDLLQSTSKYQDNLAGPSASPGQEELHDLKDLDFTPEETSGKVEVESDDEGRGQRRRKKKVETSPYKRRKRVELPTVKIQKPPESKEKEEENRTSRGGKRKLKEQPALSTVGAGKKTKLKIKSPPSSKTVKNIKHQDERSLQAVKPGESSKSKVSEPVSRKSVRIPANSLKPSPVVSVENNDISSDLKKESPKSYIESDLPVPEPQVNNKRSDSSSSTLPLDSDPEDSKPIVNFLENVKDTTAPPTTINNVVKTSSQVLAPQLPLSSTVSVPEAPEVFGPPLACSSKKNLAEEFNKTKPKLPEVSSKQVTAVNIKKEANPSQEYVEDSCGVSDPSSVSHSVLERYYSQIGSQPTQTVQSQQKSNIKTERVEQPAVERERSVSPPVSEYPLVPVVEDGGVTFPAPAQRGGRGRPGVFRGQAVRGPRGRGQPVRGALVQHGRGLPVRGALVQQGRGQPVRGALVQQGRGQPVRGALVQRGRGQGQALLQQGQAVRGTVARQIVRGGSLVNGRGQMRGQVRGVVRGLDMRPRASPHPRGGMARPGGQIIRGAQPGYARGLRGPGRGLVRPPVRPPVRAPAPLPDRLSSINGLSVTRQKPVDLPKNLRLPSGITLSHPRGIQNQPPPSRSHYNPPPAPAPAPVPDREKKQKVSLELTVEQMEALKTLGYL